MALTAAVAAVAFSLVAAGTETTRQHASGLHPVFCGQVLCGSMEIPWYQRFDDEDTTPSFARSGVNIRGRFRPVREQSREFHYLQVLTRFKADDFRWIRDPGVALPIRFVDAPPFGLRHPVSDGEGRFRTVDHKFDALPWYDEGDFPIFDDRPRAFLASARKSGAVTMEFETWVVCVIDTKEGPDREHASDDTYEVGALIGWTWGYDVTYRDVGELGVDEFEDYTFTQLPLRYVSQPSEAFKAALATPIGDTVTDRFDIRLGDGGQCPMRR